MCLINQLHKKDVYSYSEIALKKQKRLLMALAQKVYHEVTEEEQQKFAELMQIGII